VFAELDGIALAMSGQPERALAPLTKATELKPRNADYWLNLARALLDAGRAAEAVHAAQVAYALVPDNVAVLPVLFGAQRAARNFAEARKVVLRWRKLQPKEKNAKLLEEVEVQLNQLPAVQR